MSQDRFEEIRREFTKLKEKGYSFEIDPLNTKDKLKASITIHGMPNQKYGLKCTAKRNLKISEESERLYVWEQWLEQTNEYIALLGPVLQTVIDPFDAIKMLMKQGGANERQGINTIAGKSPSVSPHP